MSKKVTGITKVYATTKKLKIAGVYEDGTTFEFTFDNDSVNTKKLFEKLDEFALGLLSMLESE